MVLQYILKQFCMPQNSPLPAVYMNEDYDLTCDYRTYQSIFAACTQVSESWHSNLNFPVQVDTEVLNY